MSFTRRSLLQTSAAAFVTAAAGCLSEPGDDSDASGSGPSSYAAMFTLWDWSAEVGGDAMSVRNVLSVGEAGHGWNPPGDLTLDIAESDAFVYLDTPEFSWAQDVAAQLEGEDVPTIDAMAAVDSDDFLPFDHDHGGEDDHEGADGDDHDHEGEDEHEGEGDHEGEGGNRGGDEFHDPHVWIDPVLAQDMVEHLASEFAEIAPENSEQYRDNADQYAERLSDVDRQLSDLSQQARLDFGIFAGHNSFQYVEDRYGFRLHSPQGVTPDAEPSPNDIAETIELVEDNDVDVILYDPLETADDGPPPLAQRILDSTPASEARPLTSGDGTTEEWQDNGWGWIEQMEEINIPSLRAALDAD